MKKIGRFMDEAYQGKASGRSLKTSQGAMIFSLEDLADQVGSRPSRATVEEIAAQEQSQLDLLISADPGKKFGLLWGYLSSLAAERSPSPLHLPSRDYAGLEMERGTIILQEAASHVGERMRGGKILVQGSCGERAGWLMRSGSLYVRGDCGEYLGLLMSGGRILVKGKAARRAGWRRKGGTIAAGGYGPEAADDVLGLG
jgi:formylmethanofuran dehydrogenase subunit C